MNSVREADVEIFRARKPPANMTDTPKSNTTSLSVCVGDKIVCVKVVGRANFTSSVDFKKLINGLWEKGRRRFVLDLSECPLMDSTFLGVLAGLGLNLSHAANGQTGATIELFHSNARIADLLENLGVSHLFQEVGEGPPPADQLTPVESSPAGLDKKEVSRTCLEAHQTLMAINPDNIAKFKDVAQFLADDLKRMEQAK